ncbi:MAG: M20/M25/M40 family metallo-hydrolase [Thermoanaerobaculia bacterium]
MLALLGLVAGCARESQAAPPEVLGWFSSYLEINTTNPPGREDQAAALLRGILHREGIPTRLLVSPAGRTSLYARLEPSEPGGGALVLTHHMDVVPAGPGWSVEPFAALESGGWIWGRGSVDVKSLGIAQLAAFIDLHRRGGPVARPVIFLAVADEESGGADGTRWLLDRHDNLFTGVAGVLGEGGANRVISGTRLWWGIETSQKRPLWLKASVRGRGGHGSMLNPASAPHQLTLALSRLLERPREFRATPEARRYLEAAAPYQSVVYQKMIAELDEIVADEVPETKLFPGVATYLVDTIQVNVIDTGDRINVVPEQASALIDIRLLPDVDEQAMLEEVRELLGPRIDVETLLIAPRSAASPVDNEIYRCLEKALVPTAPVLPAFIAGVTDSRYYRERDIPAYGFSPFSLDPLETRGIHAADERISRAAFLAGVELYSDVVRRCTAF